MKMTRNISWINKSALPLIVTCLENILSLRMTAWIFSLPIRSHNSFTREGGEKLWYDKIHNQKVPFPKTFMGVGGQAPAGSRDIPGSRD